jgi:hypothetical protein
MRYFLFLLATSLFATCTPNEEEVPLYLIEQSTKDYLVFPVGSYWVYEEENTNIEDSLYLFYTESKVIPKSNSISNSYERITLNLSSSYFNDTVIRTIYKSANDSDVDLCGQFLLKNYMSYDYLYFDRNICIDSIEFTNSNFLIRNCSDSLYSILNTEYENCIYFFDKHSNTTYIFSKNIGLIRRIDSDGKVWNLKKYFINK